jgi:hypothetical protein
MCSFHKDVFKTKLDSAIVIRHFVDEPNHSMKTIDVKTNAKEFTLYFIPSDNETDFDKLRIGDVISKDKETFEMKVNNDWTFKLRYDCTY